jgi:hypothetical protein
MPASKVSDNATRVAKAQLRSKALIALAKYAEPVVCETHGGMGHLYADCYTHIPVGLVCEKNPEKAQKLLKQRGHKWGVFECDVEKALRAGLGSHLPVNFLDVDPYGDPWPTIDGFLESKRDLPEYLVIVVNDGLRALAQRQRGWTSKTLEPIVRKYGNTDLFNRWLEICREMMLERAEQAGYKMQTWTGYYPKRNDYADHHLTHFASLLVKRGL